MTKYFVIQFHLIPPPYGGVSVYVKRLSLTLCKLGYVSSAFSDIPVQGIPSEFHYLYRRFPKHARSILIIPELFSLLLHVRKFKIFHSHATFSTCFTTWIIHKCLGMPIVYTVHSQMIERDLSYLNKIDKYCLKSLAKDPKVQFITVNSKAKTKLENFGFHFFNPIKVLAPYIPPVQIGHEEDYLSPELLEFKSHNKRYILYYAESFAYDDNQEVYGTNTIIDAYLKIHKTIPELALIFCIANLGNKKEEINSLKEKVEKEGLSYKVFWQIGAVSEMWPLLKDTVLYIRPTSTDGDSVLLREALGMGVQSLASDIVDRPKDCVVYPFGDTDALVTKAIDMIEHPHTIYSSMPSNIDELISIYNSLLA